MTACHHYNWCLCGSHLLSPNLHRDPEFPLFALPATISIHSKAGLDCISKKLIISNWALNVQICSSLHSFDPAPSSILWGSLGGGGMGRRKENVLSKQKQYFQSSTLLLPGYFHQPSYSFWFISIHKQTNASLCFYCSSRIGLLLEENNVSTTTTLLNADLH